MTLSTIFSTFGSVAKHFELAAKYNFTISKQLRNVNTLRDGLVCIDALSGHKLQAPLLRAQASLATHSFTALPESQYAAIIALTHEWLLLVVTPVACYRFGSKAFKYFRRAADSTLAATMRVYLAAKATFSLGTMGVILGINCKRAAELIPKIRENPRLSEALRKVSAGLFNFFKVGSVMGIISDIMTINQASKFHTISNVRWNRNTLDESVVKECFGADIDKVQRIEWNDDYRLLLANHTAFYRRMKMVQTAAKIVDFVTMVVVTSIPVMAPLVPIIYMSTLIARLGSEFWLKRRKEQLKTALSVPSGAKPTTISKVTSLASLMATPFLLMSKTAPYAGVAIIAAVAADLISQRMSSVAAAA